MLRFLTFFCLVSLALSNQSCAPQSSEDFKKEGEAWTLNFIKELKEVRTSRELLEKAPLLKDKMDALVDLLIASKKAQPTQSDQDFPSPSSEALREELERIYGMDGGRETMEKIQKDSLLKLDAFDASLRRRAR